MKRAGNLFERIGERGNLELAFWRAQRGKASSPEVRAFQENLEEELARLSEALRDGTVEVGDYHFFSIHDPKPRVICAANFRERVLHHAIMAVCDAEFERFQIFDSYASRRGKGVDACLERTRVFCRQYRWFLKLDIHKYFDSIDHEVLLRLLARRFKEPRLLALFSRIIDSYETQPGRGVPIGNLASQYFANHYLAVLDHNLKEVRHVPGYVRYMDDFLLFADTREELTALLPGIQAFLAEELHLSLNPPVLNRCTAGIPFLSYQVFPAGLRLSQKARYRFRRKIQEANATESPEQALSLMAFIDRAHSDAFRRAVFLRGTPHNRARTG